LDGKLRCLKFGVYWVVLIFVWSNSAIAQKPTLAEPITHKITVEDGVDLHVVEWGGKGAPLLFLPSWASTSHIFDDFAYKFTDSHRVLVVNKRGHGTSSRPDHGYTIERLTKDIKVVLDKLGIQQITLVGLSRSESLTTQFAARYPERVAALIYLSGPIDRKYARDFYAQRGIRKISIQRGAVQDSILKLCNIREVHQRPTGSFDDAANELGVEWRNTDPVPPYALVKAPALAFWDPISGEINQYRQLCEKIEDKTKANELIERYAKLSVPFIERETHDLNLFKDSMDNGKTTMVPGALYHTFVSHPEVVEAKMRSFFDTNNIR
jgi:pimeloyl-ACP methyl ester carboxylesterase